LTDTLKHLGDATSRNLEFSYRPDVPVSYGEETITESNLLELRRLHPDVVHLHTFSKHQESRIGADWEWHIVGRRRTLKLRVQAKRVQRNGVLRVRHYVARSGRQQRDLLLEAAQANRMRPMYCVYCTESQRRLWKQSDRFQTGCLLADARNLPLHTRNLSSIEGACWPWHCLFEVLAPTVRIDDSVLTEGDPEETGPADLPLQPLIWNAPRILDLNEDTDREYDLTGVDGTTPLDLARVDADGAEELQRTAHHDLERRADEDAQRTVAIDVTSFEPTTEPHHDEEDADPRGPWRS